jgi:hypothetical protein
MHKKLLTIAALALMVAISAVSANTSYSIFGGALGESSNAGFAGLDFTSEPTISNPYYANPIKISMGIGSTLSSGSAVMNQNYAIIGDDQGSIGFLKSEYIGKMVEGVQFSVQADIAPSFVQIDASNIGDPNLSYGAFSRATVPVVLNSGSFANVMTYNKFYCDATNPTNTDPTSTDNSGSAEAGQASSQDNQAGVTSTLTEQATPQGEETPSQLYTPPGGPAPLPTKDELKFVPSGFKGDGGVAEDLSENLAIYYRSDFVQEDNMEEIVAAGFDYAKSIESNDISCQSVMIFAADVKSNGAD